MVKKFPWPDEAAAREFHAFLKISTRRVEATYKKCQLWLLLIREILLNG
jgi:hypothetical protein